MEEMDNTDQRAGTGTAASEPSDGPADGSPCDLDDDEMHLQRFGCMLDLIADRTRAVAERYHNGCYIVGRPGTSKTFTVLATLKRLDPKEAKYAAGLGRSLQKQGKFAEAESAYRQAIALKPDWLGLLQAPPQWRRKRAPTGRWAARSATATGRRRR